MDHWPGAGAQLASAAAVTGETGLAVHRSEGGGQEGEPGGGEAGGGRGGGGDLLCH